MPDAPLYDPERTVVLERVPGRPGSSRGLATRNFAVRDGTWPGRGPAPPPFVPARLYSFVRRAAADGVAVLVLPPGGGAGPGTTDGT